MAFTLGRLLIGRSGVCMTSSEIKLLNERKVHWKQTHTQRSDCAVCPTCFYQTISRRFHKARNKTTAMFEIKTSRYTDGTKDLPFLFTPPTLGTCCALRLEELLWVSVLSRLCPAVGRAAEQATFDLGLFGFRAVSSAPLSFSLSRG